MKFAVQRVLRFGKFVGRFWPLWTIWAIIWLTPISHGVAHRHLFGSIYEANSAVSLRDFWREIAGNWNEEIEDPLPAAQTHPRDLDLALWENVWNSQSFYGRGRSNNATPDLDGLIKKFPDQIIAYAPALQNELQIHDWNGVHIVIMGESDDSQLRATARRAHQLEPNNAAWLVAQALSASRRGDFAETLKLLQSAANCPFYDDKTLEIARRVLGAHARYGALEDYEKRAIFDKIRASNGGGWETIRFFGNRAAVLRTSGKTQQALQWSAAMAKIGALMQRDPNSPATIYDGREWQFQAWNLGAPRKRGNKTSASELFARYATQQGRADLAATTRAQAKRVNEINQLIASSANNDWDEEFWLRADNLGDYLSLGEIGGFCLICAGIYLFGWWLTVNLFSWRAGGVASSSAARVGLALVVVVPLLLAATASLWFSIFADQRLNGALNPRFLAYENGFGSLGVFSFVSAPFVLALIIALVILRRHRRDFDLPPRVHTEMALPIWARALLRWFLPLGVIGTLLCLIGGWALWILASWNGWLTVDLLAWLPPDRNGKISSLMWDMQDNPVPFIYGIFMGVVCLLAWFSKWRWATAKHLRPLTHGALRWWKESLGASIVVLSWAYLLVALLSWPVRQQADARLNRVLQSGELSVLRALKSSEQKS